MRVSSPSRWCQSASATSSTDSSLRLPVSSFRHYLTVVERFKIVPRCFDGL